MADARAAQPRVDHRFVQADEAHDRVTSEKVTRTGRSTFWLPDGARIAPHEDSLLSADGDRLMPLSPTDRIHVVGTFDAGEELPWGGRVVRPEVDAGRVLGWSLAVAASAALSGLALGFGVEACNTTARCSSPLDTEGTLWALGISGSLAALVGTSIGLGYAVHPPLELRPAGR